MTKANLSVCVSVSLVCLLAGVPAASAQVDAARLNAINARMQQRLKTYNRIPIALRQAMSGNSNVAHVAGVLKTMTPALALPLTRPTSSALLTPKAAEPSDDGVARVSDPSTDLVFSAQSGFTQSGTSTAWCGNRVVVGFNDSGSVLQTLASGVGGLSFTGVALSTNRGATFKDLGPIPPGSNPDNFLGGDPTVVCSDASHFYYSQIFSTSDVDENPITAIALSTSADGGETWSDPQAAVSKDGFNFVLDKPWLAVDPSDSKRMYLTYASLDFTFTDPACPNVARTTVEVVASEDGGATWGAPATVDAVCGSNNSVQSAHVVVSRSGQVNLAWINFTNFPTGARELRFTSYTRGKQPAGYTVIDSIVGGGDSILLQGGFRDYLGIDMAVDRSGGRKAGTLYVTWDDGRDKSVVDFASMTGRYSFDDILLRVSQDGGKTWGVAPVKINSDTQPTTGYGHDHYQPGIAVDSDGKIAACWYDRRNDPSNFSIERFCGTSTNAVTWTNTKVAAPSFGPVHNTDKLATSTYMGDYDGLAADFTKANPGFIGAFQVMSSKANPDVKAFSFK